MRVILGLVVCCLTVLQPSVQISTPTSPTYVAAVVEYNQETGDAGDTSTVTRNVANYVLYIREAAEQGADIIVFPEIGLVGYESGTKYSTPLPNPEDMVNPCDDTSSNVTEAIRTLSCEAQNQSMYVVVNVPEVAPCDNSSSNCSVYYNSNVVFDRNGTIVARYRKFNLFGETGFSTTWEAEISILDTDFGVKFGIFTCFDLMFEKPAVQLVKDWGVTDIVFPTAWFSELPFLTAVQAQASWSYSWDVNFLAAGYNAPSVGSAGSGIYAGKAGPIMAIMPVVPTTQLLVANVTKKTSPNSKSNLKHLSDGDNIIEEFPFENSFSNSIAGKISGIRMKRDYLEPYETFILNEGHFVGEERLCHNELCCDFQLDMHSDHQDHNTSLKDYVYRLAVFDGVRSFTYVTGGVQVCAVIFCANSSVSSCGYEFEMPDQAAFYTVFNKIHISGNFRVANSTQLPTTLVQGYGVLSPDTFQFTTEEIPEKSEVRIDMNTTVQISKLLTFGIYGRDFLKDGEPVTEPNGGVRCDAASVSLVLSVAVFHYFRSH